MTRRVVVVAAALAGVVAMMPVAPAQAATGDPTAGFNDGFQWGGGPAAIGAVSGGDMYWVADSTTRYSGFVIGRLTPAGVDMSFADDPDDPENDPGQVIEYDATAPYDAFVTAGIARQADGKFLVAGAHTGSNAGPTGVGVVRVLPNGDLDPTFDGDGKMTVPVPAGTTLTVGEVGVGASGRIVVSAVEETAAGEVVSVFAVGAGGKVDKTFGTQGRAVALGGAGSRITGTPPVSVTSNGKIITGARECRSAGCSVGVVRLTGKGVLDGTFSGDGRTDVALAARGDDSEVRYAAVHPLPGGHILVVADDWASTVDPVTGLTETVEVMARLRPDGSMNPSFDSDGVRTRIGVGPTLASAVQPDGKVLLLSRYPFYFETDWSEWLSVIRRFNWNGARDTSLGSHQTIPSDRTPMYGRQPLGPAVDAGVYNSHLVVGSDNTVTTVDRYISDQSRMFLFKRFDL